MKHTHRDATATSQGRIGTGYVRNDLWLPVAHGTGPTSRVGFLVRSYTAYAVLNRMQLAANRIIEYDGLRGVMSLLEDMRLQRSLNPSAVSDEIWFVALQRQHRIDQIRQSNCSKRMHRL